MDLAAHITRVAHSIFCSPVFLFLFSGFLVGVSFIVPILFWCAFVGIICFIEGVESTRSSRGVLFGAFLTGFIKAGIAVVWFFDVYPANWLGGATPFQQLVVLFGCWFGTALSLGVGYAFIGFIAWHIRAHSQRMLAFSYPFLFVLGEILGAIVFSIYTYGGGGSLNTHFGYSMVGYTLAYHGLLKYAAVFAGVYGLTFVLTALSVATFQAFKRAPEGRAQIIVIASIVSVFILSGYIAIPNQFENKITIAAVSTKFQPYASLSQIELNGRQEEMSKGIARALEEGASVVVLPEDARFGYGRNENEVRAFLASLPHEKNAIVVDSYRTPLSSSSVVIRGYLHDIDDITYTADKQYIVPMGEFLPYLHGKAVDLIDGRRFFDSMTYTEGVKDIPLSAPSSIPNVLFCFESGVPTIAKEKAVVRKTPLMVHPVSHAWFHSPKRLWNEERQMLIVQALYARASILQAGNLAPSELYRTDGSVDTGVTVFEEGRVSVKLFTL